MISDEQVRKLKGIKKKRNASVIAFLAYLPFMYFAMFFTDKGNILLGLAALYMLVTFTIAATQMSSVCPNCNKKFFYTWGWGSPWSRKCLHCGLDMHTMKIFSQNQ